MNPSIRDPAAPTVPGENFPAALAFALLTLGLLACLAGAFGLAGWTL